MATRRLYYDDSYLQRFQARVVECIPGEPFRTAWGTVPVWEVLLDRSAFYPTSGGQPNDVGKIENARVLDVREENQEIVHIVDQELPPGEIQACIDWPRRFDHMQQHTGQHLLSAMFQERYGLPTVSFHLGSELCTIDLRGPEPTTDLLQGAQRAANAVIFEDRPVNVRYGTAEQMAELGVRKEVERQGILRAIEIESADLQPCGGTHVRTTGQIGLLVVRRCTKIRQDWRLQFACGARAERLATGDFQLLRSIAEKLRCAPEESPVAVEKAAAERDAHFKSLRTTLQQLAESRAKLLGSSFALADRVRVIEGSLKEESPELLLPLATELAKNERTVALLVHEPTGQLVFAQHPTAGKDLAGLLRQLRAVIPAEGGGTRDFVRAKLADPVHSSTALELAKKMALG
jgi:alanyl-tRNA synthetase